MKRNSGTRSGIWFQSILSLALTILVCASPASAYLYTNWSSPGVISLTDSDPPGPVPNKPGQNITQVMYAWESNVHYFRYDLAETPDKFAGNYALQYGVFIDALNGYGTSTGMPPLTSNIDVIFQSDYEKNSNTYSSSFKAWTGSGFVTVPDSISALLGFDFLATGNILEWKISGPAFTYNWWGATYKDDWQDVSSKVVTPIPGAAWLFASGALALIALRRRARI